MSAPSILFLQSGPAMPDLHGKIKSKYDFFSNFSSGLIISPVAGEDFMGLKNIGKFDFCSFPYHSGNSLIRNLKFIGKVFWYVFCYTKHTKIDVVVSPNPLLCGMIALLIRIFTGAKVIVEVNGNFEAAFTYGGCTSYQLVDRMKHAVSQTMIPFVLRRVDMVKLVYTDQLMPLALHNEVPVRVFPNYVPIKNFLIAEKGDHGYVLLLGYPWYLKGVDVLIKAFRMISPQFPTLRLKIVGWCPEGREYFEELAEGNLQIELCEPVHYEEVIPLMANCSVYVLASRTDSSPRVLREAMAACKPIVASAVDGVPELIKDRFNGLLFEKENVEELAEKLKELLECPSFAKKLAENGFQYVQQVLSEESYTEKYRAMIEAVLDRCSQSAK